MPIITLTTDWGEKDHYLGAVKGRLLHGLPNVNIVDISHGIKKFDSLEAAFILRNSYATFPKGTIHILGVNSEASIKTPHIVIKYDDYFFIGADNGIFSMVFDDIPNEIVEIDIMADSNYFTFSTRDVFIKVAIMLANGTNISELGNKKSMLNKSNMWKPTFEGGLIKGNIIYIDSYDNIITNITESFFKNYISKQPFEINLKSVRYTMNQLNSSYGDVIGGEIATLFGSTGFLEIAINKGKAAQLLNLKVNDSIMIKILE